MLCGGRGANPLDFVINEAGRQRLLLCITSRALASQLTEPTESRNRMETAGKNHQKNLWLRWPKSSHHCDYPSRTTPSHNDAAIVAVALARNPVVQNVWIIIITRVACKGWQPASNQKAQ